MCPASNQSGAFERLHGIKARKFVILASLKKSAACGTSSWSFATFGGWLRRDISNARREPDADRGRCMCSPLPHLHQDWAHPGDISSPGATASERTTALKPPRDSSRVHSASLYIAAPAGEATSHSSFSPAFRRTARRGRGTVALHSADGRQAPSIANASSVSSKRAQ
jgi:hypothetical protein